MTDKPFVVLPLGWTFVPLHNQAVKFATDGFTRRYRFLVDVPWMQKKKKAHCGLDFAL